MTTPPEAESAGARSLRTCNDTPYLIGRLVGLAQHLASWLPAETDSTQFADKLAAGRMQPYPTTVAALQVAVSRDLARAGVPEAYGAAFGDIVTRLEPVTAWPGVPWPDDSDAAGLFLLGQHHQSAALTRDTAGRP